MNLKDILLQELLNVGYVNIGGKQAKLTKHTYQILENDSIIWEQNCSCVTFYELCFQLGI